MPCNVADPKVDPLIKCFAERHKYFHIDSIAVRDVGYVPPHPGSGTRNGGSGPVSRHDNLQPLTSKSAKSATFVTSSQSQSTSSKRVRSPEHRCTREESRDYRSKRARPSSPPPRRPGDSHLWIDGGSGGRFNSPMWQRDRGRRSGQFKGEHEEDKSMPLPSVLNWFMGTLPPPNTFDGAYSCFVSECCLTDRFVHAGPVFCADDLMQVFRNAVIPSTSAARCRSPPPAPRSSGECVRDVIAHFG